MKTRDARVNGFRITIIGKPHFEAIGYTKPVKLDGGSIALFIKDLRDEGKLSRLAATLPAPQQVWVCLSDEGCSGLDCRCTVCVEKTQQHDFSGFSEGELFSLQAPASEWADFEVSEEQTPTDLHRAGVYNMVGAIGYAYNSKVGLHFDNEHEWAPGKKMHFLLPVVRSEGGAAEDVGGGSRPMANVLAFNIPFCGFAGTNFINCFASTYMFLEGIGVGRSDYDCRQSAGKPCNSCGNCGKGGSTPISVQEKYFFLFDTMCGRSSLRCRFDGTPTKMQKMIGETDFYDGGTDSNIEFLFGFAGWEYRKLTDLASFRDAIIASVDAGKPVIAKVRTDEARFRVITGYEGESLICPDYTNAQNRPERAPACDEIDALFIVGEKVSPRYTLVDGLERIRQVMAYNIQENLWGGYIEKMGLYTADSLGRASVEEKKARMKRVAETMWHTFNCHNFAEVFRRYRVNDAANANLPPGSDAAAVYDMVGDMKKLRGPEFQAIFDKISGPCCGYTHDLAWALIGLEQCADWSKHAAGYFGEMVELTLCRIAKNDAELLAAVNQLIGMLRSKEGPATATSALAGLASVTR